MLSKSKRFNLKFGFNFVAAGRKLETPNLKLLFRFKDQTHALIGIALKTAFFKKAHLRNKAKRLASGAIEKIYPSLPKNINLVIMPKSSILDAKTEDLIKELESVKDIYKDN